MFKINSNDFSDPKVRTRGVSPNGVMISKSNINSLLNDPIAINKHLLTRAARRKREKKE